MSIVTDDSKIEKIIFDGIEVTTGDGRAELYDVLKYSGLVTKDMTHKEMCNVLRTRYPQDSYIKTIAENGAGISPYGGEFISNAGGSSLAVSSSSRITTDVGGYYYKTAPFNIVGVSKVHALIYGNKDTWFYQTYNLYLKIQDPTGEKTIQCIQTDHNMDVSIPASVLDTVETAYLYGSFTAANFSPSYLTKFGIQRLSLEYGART